MCGFAIGRFPLSQPGLGLFKSDLPAAETIGRGAFVDNGPSVWLLMSNTGLQIECVILRFEGFLPIGAISQ